MKKVAVLSAFALSVSLFTLPAAVMAADAVATPIEKLVSELAQQPEQHQAVAQYYNDKADAAQKELEQHQKMRKAYFGSGKNQQATDSMRKHCDSLVKLNESMVKEYKAMAAEHETMAVKKP
jgi:ribosomal protein L9